MFKRLSTAATLFAAAMLQSCALAAARNNEVIIYSLEKDDGSEVPLLHTIEDVARYYDR